MGTNVGVSVGGLCVFVSVGRGVSVCDAVAEAVKVGTGVKVLEAGTPVDVSEATGVGETVGLPLLKLQERVIAINGMMKEKLLIFMSSLYLESKQ